MPYLVTIKRVIFNEYKNPDVHFLRTALKHQSGKRWSSVRPSPINLSLCKNTNEIGHLEHSI